MPDRPALLAISNYQDNLNVVRPEGRWFVALARDFGYRVTLMTRIEGAAYLNELREAGVKHRRLAPGEQVRGRRQTQDTPGTRCGGRYDLLHLFNNKSIYAGIRAARGWPGKVITYRGYTGNIHWWDPSMYLSHLSPRVDAITCVSGAVRDSFRGQPFFDLTKTAVVGKGHDPAWYEGVEATDLSAEFNIPPDRITLTVVANARTMKGMDYSRGRDPAATRRPGPALLVRR